MTNPLIEILIFTFFNALVNLVAVRNNYFVGAERKWSRALMMSICSLVFFSLLFGLMDRWGGLWLVFAVSLFPVYVIFSFPIFIGVLSIKPDLENDSSKIIFIFTFCIGFLASLYGAVVFVEQVLK